MQRITGLLLHPNSGDLVLTCSADGTIRMWNIPSRREVCRVYESVEPVLGMFVIFQSTYARVQCIYFFS